MGQEHLRTAAAGLGLLGLGAVCFVFAQSGSLLVPLGAALFGILVLLCLAAPDKAFLALVACSTLIPITAGVKLGPLPYIGPTRALMAAFFLAAALHVVFRGPLAPGSVARRPLLPFLALYLASGLVSSLFSVEPLVSVYAMVGREILEQAAMFYLFVAFLQTPGFFRRLRLVLYAAATVVCLFAFVEQAARANPFLRFFEDEFYDFRAGILRVRATFFHPIALACWLNFVIPLAVVDFLRERRTDRRVLYALLLLLMAGASLMTVSRAPWFALGLQLSLFALYLARRRLHRLALLLIGAAIAVLAVVVAYGASETAHQLLRPLLQPSGVTESSTEYYRWVVISTVLGHLTEDRIAFGFGPNAFSFAGLVARFSDHSRALTAPDMHYARLAFEYGFVGLGLFLLLMAAVLALCVRAVRRAPEGEPRLWALGALGATLGFMIVNLTVSMYTMYPLGLFFWMWVAVAAVQVPLAQGTAGRR